MQLSIGHETVGVVAAMGPKVRGFQIGDRVVADNSELCGQCFYCRRGEELLCENFEAHGVTLNGGFAEYCAYPGKRQNGYSFGPVLMFPGQPVEFSRSKIYPTSKPHFLNPLPVRPMVWTRLPLKWALLFSCLVLVPPAL